MGEIRPKPCEGVGITWPSGVEGRAMTVFGTYELPTEPPSGTCPNFRLKSPNLIYKSSKNRLEFQSKIFTSSEVSKRTMLASPYTEG